MRELASFLGKKIACTDKYQHLECVAVVQVVEVVMAAVVQVPIVVVGVEVANAVQAQIVLGEAVMENAVQVQIVLEEAVMENAVRAQIVVAGVEVANAVQARIVLEEAAMENAVQARIVVVAAVMENAVRAQIVVAGVEVANAVQVRIVLEGKNMRNEIKLSRSVICIRRQGKSLFFNPNVPSWIVTNKNGELILALCNGKRSIEDIVCLFVKRYGQGYKNVVNNFLIKAINSNIFLNENKLTEAKISNYNLRILQISLTSYCNLKCSYCYATDRIERGLRSLELDDYKKLIDDTLKISSNIQVVLTGGEPLLNNDCFSIGEYAKQKKCQVHLLTNGTLINNRNIDFIKKIFDLVIVSIDGSNKELHEKHRGLNSYSAALRAVDLLSKEKVNFFISMTVNKMNINDIGAMVRKYGTKMRFAPLFDAGNAKHFKHSISGLEYYSALAKVKGINPLNYCETSLERAKQCKTYKCAMGDAELSISESGDVYPCQLLHNKEFYAGNILNQSIIDIYHDSQALLKCKRITVDNIKGCSKCFLRYVCGGACRARAYYESGKIDVSGKFCKYEKEAFINGIFKLYSENGLQRLMNG